jgi:hypothetical protein
VHREEIGTSFVIAERDRDFHLATQCGVFGLELVHFDDLLVRDEPHEAAMVCVGMSGRLTSRGRRIVRKRYPERAAFARVECKISEVLRIDPYYSPEALGMIPFKDQTFSPTGLLHLHHF